MCGDGHPKCPQRTLEILILVLSHGSLVLATAALMCTVELSFEADCSRPPSKVMWSACKCTQPRCEWIKESAAMKSSWWLYVVAECLAICGVLMIDISTFEPRIMDDVKYSKIFTAVFAIAGVLMLTSLILYIETTPHLQDKPKGVLKEVAWPFPVAWAGAGGVLASAILGLSRTWTMAGRRAGKFYNYTRA